MSVFWDDDPRRVLVFRDYHRAPWVLQVLARIFGTEKSYTPIGTSKWYSGLLMSDTFYAYAECDEPDEVRARREESEKVMAELVLVTQDTYFPHKRYKS